LFKEIWIILPFLILGVFWIKEKKRSTFYLNLLNSLEDLIVVIQKGKIKFANETFLSYFPSPVCILPFLLQASKKTLLKIEYEKKEFIFKVKLHPLPGKDYAIILIDLTETYKRQESLKKLAIKDPLTGLYNRYLLEKIALEKIEEAELLGDFLLFVMFDIDHFKEINDFYGHDKGDEVLVEVAKMIRQSFRATDPIFRVGGEEFLAILVTSNIQKILDLLEHLRQRVEKRRFEGIDRKVTLSIGVAKYKKGDTVQTLYKRADKALYRSKNLGRNQITYIGEEDG